MLLVIELGSDVMQNIVCNTKYIIFVTVIRIPCKTIRKKINDNKKKVMQKFLEFFYHLTCFKAPGVSLGGSGVSIGGVRILRVVWISTVVCVSPFLPTGQGGAINVPGAQVDLGWR